jgi:signal transduction histidine kinase/ActR/RegA family two-component response regulator
MTGIPLRRRFIALTAIGILPLAFMAWLGLYLLGQMQQSQSERVGVELARSVAAAVDAELHSAISILEALASTPTLDRDDLAGFRERAERVLALKAEWTAISLIDLEGHPVVDTRTGPDERPSPLAERESFDRVVRTRAPAVGGLMQHPQSGWIFAVRVPVIRQGTLRYIATALVKPEAIRDLLTMEQLPSDWVISIVDANGLRVARSKAHEENLGGRLSDTVQAVVNQGGREGVGVAYSLEGDRMLTPYSRLASSGWVAVLGLPTTVIDAAARNSLGVYGGGIVLSLIIGTLGSLWVARSISRPIADLRAAAEALGRSEPPVPPQTSIQEIRDVGLALKGAAEELRRNEVERDELLRKERRAREAAEAADRAKDEFMTVLSHELRTPLSAVYGWARMLQSGEIRDATMTSRAVDAIVRNAQVQGQLIDDLLDLSRITSGMMRLDVRPVQVQAVLQGALDAVRPAADAKTIRIQTDLEADAGLVRGDPGRLQQVVWNLLMNAVKFTPSGGQVELGLRRIESQVEIVVADTGEGIAAEILPHVFERFRQADSSSTRTHGGLGLGLALVKHLVELHGGTVIARSAGKDSGATFIVTLPAAQPEPVAERIPRAPVGAPTAESHADGVRLDGLQVLIADNDGETANLLEAILSSAGAEVRTCLSASAALDLLQRWRPDVLVSDIEMPGEDGYWLIRKVRALAADAGGDTPAIALTAYGLTQERRRSIDAGFNMYVQKPVDPSELTAIIAGVAGRPSQPRVT